MSDAARLSGIQARLNAFLAAWDSMQGMEPNPILKDINLAGTHVQLTVADIRAVLAEVSRLSTIIETELASYRENFPCDGGCNMLQGPDEECSLHGRSPRQLWEIIGCLSVPVSPKEPKNV